MKSSNGEIKPNHPRLVPKKIYFSIYVQFKDQSFYNGSALHEEKSKSEFVIEKGLFNRLNFTEGMEIPSQR
jgi:hypothetical protein